MFVLQQHKKKNLLSFFSGTKKNKRFQTQNFKKKGTSLYHIYTSKKGRVETEKRTLFEPSFRCLVPLTFSSINTYVIGLSTL